LERGHIVPRELPPRAAHLHQDGINQLVEKAKNDPEFAEAAADAFDRDPKATLLHLFDLTDRQRQAIENTPDEYIRERASKVVDVLRDPQKRQSMRIQFDPGPSPDSVIE
jgi:hypothetical protein